MSTSDASTEAPDRFVAGIWPKALVRFPADLDKAGVTDAEALIATEVDDDALTALGTLTGLIDLTITGDYGDDSLAALANLPRLEELSVRSTKATGTGLRHLAGRCPLRRLSLNLLDGRPAAPADLTAATAGLGHLESLEVGITNLSADHVQAVPALPQLKTLTLAGGGNVFGSDDGNVDPVTTIQLLRRLAALRTLVARWKNQASMLDHATIVILLKARPGLTGNGSWYAPNVFDRPFLTGASAGSARSPAPPEDEPAVLDLTPATFDATVGTAPLALLHFWSSHPDQCSKTSRGSSDLSGVLDVVATHLQGRVTVGRGDLHEHPELAERIPSAALDLVYVLRRGQLDAVIGAHDAAGVVVQLKPLIGP